MRAPTAHEIYADGDGDLCAYGGPVFSFLEDRIACVPESGVIVWRE